MLIVFMATAGVVIVMLETGVTFTTVCTHLRGLAIIGEMITETYKKQTIIIDHFTPFVVGHFSEKNDILRERGRYLPGEVRILYPNSCPNPISIRLGSGSSHYGSCGVSD